MARILFLTPYPAGRAPSQRFRFEQYLGILAAHGHQCQEVSFLDEATWGILYRPGHAGGIDDPARANSIGNSR